jgi:hypothetical protein
MRHHLRVATLVLATAIAALIAPAPSAGASGAGGADNVVLTTNTVDGNAVARDNVQVAYDPGDTVANQNIASARSTSCTGCRTVAVAMQIVIVESTPSDFEPGNAAAATNGGCDSCDTYAYAFQHIIQTGRVVYLSGAGQRHLAELRAQVDAVTRSSLSYLDMKAQLEGLFAQIIDTVSNDLRAAGAPADGTTTEQATAV